VDLMSMDVILGMDRTKLMGTSAFALTRYTL